MSLNITDPAITKSVKMNTSTTSSSITELDLAESTTTKLAITNVSITDSVVTDAAITESTIMDLTTTYSSLSDTDISTTAFTDSAFTDSPFTDSGFMDSYDSNASDYSNNYYGAYDYGDKYMYTGYSFERPFYLYILEVISIITFLGNLVVISVLLRRKMRNPTNMVLTAIAVTDSLTALVVLPTYIMVYTRYYSLSDEGYDNDYDDTNFTDSDYGNYDSGYHNDGAVDGCELTENLCNGFMISKYFLSKSFHSMSIFLTLFLGIQRYISIRFPYKSQSMLNLPRTIVCCGAIVFLSPFLHIYHLFGTRALAGNCQWELSEDGCGTGCIYLWLAFFIRHFTPCMILVVFTVLFIRQLHAGERTLRRMESSQSQISRRKDENRRISMVVTAVVVVFLIPEIPYSIFLLYNAFDKAVNQGKGIDLEANRAINLVYELFLVLSFHANIYIYTFCNRRFRRALLRVYLNPVRRILGTTEILSQSSSLSHKPSNRKTDTGSGLTQTEMKPMVKSVPSN